jgi:hypothetical protein
LTYPGAPKDGKSDVDRHHFAKDVGKAKEGFERAGTRKEARSGEQRSGASVPDSIKKHRPEMALRPDGNARSVDKAMAQERYSKEWAAEKKKNAAVERSNTLKSGNKIDHNKDKDNSKGR